jgi:hypothetical protein
MIITQQQERSDVPSVEAELTRVESLPSMPEKDGEGASRPVLATSQPLWLVHLTGFAVFIGSGLLGAVSYLDPGAQFRARGQCVSSRSLPQCVGNLPASNLSTSSLPHCHIIANQFRHVDA